MERKTLIEKRIGAPMAVSTNYLSGLATWAILAIVTISCIAIGTITFAHAESSQMSVVHNPPTVRDLPEPGKQFKIALTVKNMRELSPDIRAYVVTDGELTQISPVRTYPGEDKDAIAEFSFFAPLAEISYQFVAKSETGAITPSKRFVIRRQCLPRLKIDRDYPTDEASHGLSLAQKAEELERLIIVYEQATKTIDELKALVPVRSGDLDDAATSEESK